MYVYALTVPNKIMLNTKMSSSQYHIIKKKEKLFILSLTISWSSGRCWGLLANLSSYTYIHIYIYIYIYICMYKFFYVYIYIYIYIYIYVYIYIYNFLYVGVVQTNVELEMQNLISFLLQRQKWHILPVPFHWKNTMFRKDHWNVKYNLRGKLLYSAN